MIQLRNDGLFCQILIYMNLFSQFFSLYQTEQIYTKEEISVTRTKHNVSLYY